MASKAFVRHIQAKMRRANKHGECLMSALKGRDPVRLRSVQVDEPQNRNERRRAKKLTRKET